MQIGNNECNDKGIDIDNDNDNDSFMKIMTETATKEDGKKKP